MGWWGELTSTGTDTAVAALVKEINTDLERAEVDENAPVSGSATPAGPRPTPDEAKAMLEAVRKRADGWRNGIGATFTLILASLAIKPGDGFMKYTGDTRTMLMWLLGLSILSALIGLLLLVNAANGPVWLTELVGAQASTRRYLRRYIGAQADLRRGQVAWALSLLLFCAAVAATWLTDPPPSP